MIDFIWLIMLPIVMGVPVIFIKFNIAKKIIAVFQGLMVFASILNFVHIKKNGELLQNIAGWPDYIAITLRADLLAAAMVMLATVIFMALILFSMKKKFADSMFLFLFIALEGLIIGIFLANDLFSLFVLIEVATVIISILIMYKKDTSSIYDGTLYLLINVVAMSFFLFGTGMIYKTTGVLDLYGIKEVLGKMTEPDSVMLPYAFIVTAISLKAALMPLFSWLPKAHGTPSAPSVISAVLSGLYVKNGIYLFVRVQDAFSGLIDTSSIFVYMGLLTAIIGFLLAVVQDDIKLILAYSTVSQIGLIMMALNLGDERAFWGGLYHIFNHAVFKTTLFLAAGVITDHYKTRDAGRIRGVYKNMPVISTAAIFAILGIIGAPFFNGSISKYLISFGLTEFIGEIGILIVNLGTVTIFVRFSEIFFGESNLKKPKTDGYTLSVITFLGILCFIGGIFGQSIISFLFNEYFEVNIESYIQKAASFLITLALGYGLYYGFIKKVNIARFLQKHELSFNGVCTAITIFFIFILSYVRITH